MPGMNSGATVRLFDARRRRYVPLPEPAEGPVTVRFAAREADGTHSVDRERGVVLAEFLCRVLAWKGHRVRVQDESVPGGPGHGTCPRASRGNWYCVDVWAPGGESPVSGETEPLCHVLVGPVLEGVRCMFGAHREHGRATLAALAKNHLVPDLRFAMLAAGHYRHPRHFWCNDVHSGWCFDDARATRRRFERLVRRAEPLPDLRSHAETVRALGSGEGGRRLDLLDRAISDDLHAPRALHALYAALRRGRLTGDEQAALAATARVLLPMGNEPAGQPGSRG